MRKSTRRELNKLRELIAFLIHGKRCYFCKQHFTDPNEYESATHGDARGTPLAVRITIHHQDGDHDHNERANHRLAHESCHKSYHARRRARRAGRFA